jgi:hypothetical protein
MWSQVRRVVREVAAAERAHELVAVEELAVVQRRDGVEALDGERLAADGDDRVGGDVRALTGAVATTAPEGELLAPQLPGNAFLGVVPDRLLPGDPAVRNAVLVQGEDEWQAAVHRFLPVKSPTWIILLDQFTKFSPGTQTMSLDRVDAGRDLANDFNVIIEIPMHADPIKYEVDKETGALFVDRFVSTSMHYPCNYGYVPQTISADGTRSTSW